MFDNSSTKVKVTTIRKRSSPSFNVSLIVLVWKSYFSVVPVWKSISYVVQRFQSGWTYSNAESVSKSVVISGSFVLGSMAVSSGTMSGVSTEGESFLMEDSLCCPDYL